MNHWDGKKQIQICGLLLRCEICFLTFSSWSWTWFFGFLHSLLAAASAALPTLGVAVMAAGRKRKKLWPGCACEASWVNCESSPTLLRAEQHREDERGDSCQVCCCWDQQPMSFQQSAKVYSNEKRSLAGLRFESQRRALFNAESLRRGSALPNKGCAALELFSFCFDSVFCFGEKRKFEWKHSRNLSKQNQNKSMWENLRKTRENGGGQSKP